MRKRPIILTAAVAVAGLAILGTVVAQQPPTKGPIGPAPATPVVRPPQDWTPTPPPPGYKPSQPPQNGAVRSNNGQVAPAVSFNQPGNNPAQGSTPVNRPRLGQAGVSTGEIKPVGAQEIPQPSMDVQPGGTNPKPIIEVEPQPDNKFPSAGATPPGGEIPPIGTPPIGIAPPIGTPPSGAVPPIGTPTSGAIPPIAAPPSGVVPPPVGGGATPPGVMPKFPPGTPGAPTGTPIIPGVPGAPGAPGAPAAPIAPTIGSTPLPSKTTQNVTVEAVCPSEVVFGGDFTYELVVHNEGNVPVQGVRIEDEIPATTKYISSDPPAERSGDKLVWAIGAMEAHTDKRITVKVRPGEEGELHSRATVTYTGSVEARTRITRPRLTVNAACIEVCRVGEDAMFQVKITNSGTGPAEELMLRAEMSEGLFFPKEPKPKLETRLPTIPAGESQTIKLPLNAVKAGLNSCQFTVVAKGCSETGAKAQVNVVEPLLQIAHAGPAKCLVRSEPIYEITLNNPGTAPTEAITLYAQLPEGFDYVQCSDTGLFNATTRTISWKLQALAPNGSKTVALKIRSTVAGNVTLQTKAISLAEQPITVAAAGAKPVGRMLEAKGETAIRAEGVPAVRFEVKDVDDPVEAGKEAIYEIRVTNQGTGACTNVQLMAALADGTTFSGASGPTNVKAQGQTLVFDPIKSLPVKGETVYTVRVKGNVIGDQRFRVQLTCDQVRTPVVKEESTSFYKQ